MAEVNESRRQARDLRDRVRRAEEREAERLTAGDTWALASLRAAIVLPIWFAAHRRWGQPKEKDDKR